MKVKVKVRIFNFKKGNAESCLVNKVYINIFIFLLFQSILTRRLMAFLRDGFHYMLWFGRAKSLLFTLTIRLICFVPTLPL